MPPPPPSPPRTLAATPARALPVPPPELGDAGLASPALSPSFFLSPDVSRVERPSARVGAAADDFADAYREDFAGRLAGALALPPPPPPPALAAPATRSLPSSPARLAHEHREAAENREAANDDASSFAPPSDAAVPSLPFLSSALRTSAEGLAGALPEAASTAAAAAAAAQSDSLAALLRAEGAGASYVNLSGAVVTRAPAEGAWLRGVGSVVVAPAREAAAAAAAEAAPPPTSPERVAGAEAALFLPPPPPPPPVMRAPPASAPPAPTAPAVAPRAAEAAPLPLSLSHSTDLLSKLRSARERASRVL
jgi:hypothetical protein